MRMTAIAFAALMAMGSMSCTAQEKNDGNNRPQRPNPQEMVQRRTDDAVKKYGLDEAQAKKLLELNQKYDTLLMRPMMGGPRRGGRPEGGPRGQRGRGEGQRPDSIGQRPEPTAEMKAKMEADRKKIDEARKAYDTELQSILTTEQYEKYKQDSQRRGGRPDRMR